MKKLLGVSVVAMLTVCPMMANAAGSAAPAAPEAGNSASLATAGYVKGAYTAIRNDIHVAANGNYIKSADSVAENLGSLDTQVKANADAIGSLSDAVDEAIGALGTGDDGYATKPQVVETINHATVATVTDWTDTTDGGASTAAVTVDQIYTPSI